MTVVADYADTVTQGGSSRDDPPWEEGTYYDLLKCPSCGQMSLRSYFWHEGMESEDDTTVTELYPSSTKIPLGLPERIEKAFIDALKTKSVNANAFGVLIGRVIEMVCLDRGATGHFLSHKLKDLAGKGEIPNKLVEIAERLASFRNVGAHAELGDLTPDEIPIVEDLSRALLDYIYTAPHLAQRASERLDALTAARQGKGLPSIQTP